MVDSTSNVTSLQNVSSTNRTQPADNNQRRTENRDETASATPRDEVALSEEAISISQAQETAENTRAVLEDNPEQSLGLDPNFEVDERV